MLKTGTVAKILIILSTLLLLAGCGESTTNPDNPPAAGKYAEVAKCLTAKGAIMYGAYWCPHCQNMKAAFGDDFQFIKYQECDPAGPNGNMKVCLDAGISSYPTWSFPGQGNLAGEEPIFLLAKLANCEDKLPAEDKQKLADAEKQLDQASGNSASTEPAKTEPAPGTIGQAEPVGRTPVASGEQTAQPVTP